jgi:hypothetical protein
MVEQHQYKQQDRTEDHKKLEPSSAQAEVTFNQLLMRYPDYSAIFKFGLKKLRKFLLGY